MIENYTNQLISANDAYLESEHCKNAAEIFAGGKNENVDTEKLTEDVENELSALEEKMKSLYTALSDTLDDYNDYNTQKHISLLTGVKCYDNVSTMLYELIAVVITGTLMIMLALALEIIKAYKKEQLTEAEYEEDKENEGT